MTLRSMILVTFVAATMAGCSGNASCSSAMDHFYTQGCTITVGGAAVSKSTASTACDGDLAIAKNKGCGGVYQTALNCLASATSCGACNSELAAINSCAASHP